MKRTSVFEQWVGLEETRLRLFAFQVDLILGFTARYPVTLDGGHFLRTPAAASCLLANGRGVSKGIGCQLAELLIGRHDWG